MIDSILEESAPAALGGEMSSHASVTSTGSFPSSPKKQMSYGRSLKLKEAAKQKLTTTKYSQSSRQSVQKPLY